MNINPEFNSEERPNVELVVEQAMSYLFNTFIKPQEAELDEDDLASVSLIGIMFKTLPKKPRHIIKCMRIKKMIFFAIK